jgi:prolipoprotein diacylglyceryltransferase
VPWAIIFGSPADGSLAYPRHPAQLYEAFCYLCLFFVILKLKNSQAILSKPGKLFGIFCVAASVLRFGLEFLKENQSVYDGSFLNMGQLLTIPFFVFGVCVLFFDEIMQKKTLLLKYLNK